MQMGVTGGGQNPFCFMRCRLQCNKIKEVAFVPYLSPSVPSNGIKERIESGERKLWVGWGGHAHLGHFEKWK